MGRLLVEMALSIAPEGQVGSGRVGRLDVTGPDIHGGSGRVGRLVLTWPDMAGEKR